MYKHLDKLNVKSNLPTDQISQYTAKKFRTSSDICKYTCTLEEEIISKEETSINDNRKSSTRNEEIMKSLAELRDEFKQPEKSYETTTSDSITDDRKAHNTAVKNSTVLRMKAETVAELYLGTEDTSLFLKFLDFYVNLMESIDASSISSNIPDEKVVKSFNLFSGDVKKAKEFLVTAVELEELGFEEDKVVSALMLFSNDREAALDFLMKN